ncbi:MAG TPA: hypothetical protein VGQ44_08105 [Gemmatimonadaceae bacterium]|nr:hypothetical protein [Gemmatimonadaceae bacterium]
MPSSATPLTSAAAPPSPPISFPITWLLEHASAPIKFRSVTEVAKPAGAITEQIASLPFTYEPALTLAVMQQADGTWNHAMLSIPSSRGEHFDGIGTITAVRRLLEYGWDKDTPPLTHARRILFRLLAEDNDPEYLFEFGSKGTFDEDLAKRSRAILREAAAAALAQAGYEGDPRLRGAARRILERVVAYIRSPLAQKPFVRMGNQHVLAAEAAPPSIHLLFMLAYMPLFRNEHHDAMEAIYQHVSQPLPRQEGMQLVGTKAIAQPQLVLGDMLPNRNAADDDVAFAITWLELMARLGYLRRNDNWSKLYDRFLDDRDEHGVWHPHKGMSAVRSSNPYLWPLYPLEDHLAGDERWTDVTFRLGLIGRLAGRTIELV